MLCLTFNRAFVFHIPFPHSLRPVIHMLQAKPEPSIDSAVLLQYKGDVLLILFGKLVYAGIRNASAWFVHVKSDGRVKSVPPVSHYAVLLLTFCALDVFFCAYGSFTLQVSLSLLNVCRLGIYSAVHHAWNSEISNLAHQLRYRQCALLTNEIRFY